MGALLEVDRISKRFGRRPALSEVSFEVAQGEIVGFVGPNGAGKSTTLRILAGLLAPDAGTVRVDGVDEHDDPRGVRSQIGALIESPAYYPTLTALDHLEYVARLRGTCDRTRLERRLRDVGLDPTSRKPVGRFSLGMKQRLGIAMAIADGPALLVLDEPMNGLDPLGMADLREFLRRLPATTGGSVLVSSHLLNEVEQICDRVLFIRDGQLLSHAALGTSPADGRQDIWLRTSDDVQAERVLREAGILEATALSPTGGLACRMAVRDVSRVAPALVGAGIELLELTPRTARLEDVYLSYYADQRSKELG